VAERTDHSGRVYEVTVAESGRSQWQSVLITVAEGTDYCGRAYRLQWQSAQVTVAECKGHSGRVC